MSFDYLAFSSYLPDAVSTADMTPGEAPPLDAASLEALRALGYVE